MRFLVHRLTIYLVLVTIVLVVAATFSLSLLVQNLPAEPSPALVGLLSVIAGVLVSAIGALVGALAAAYVAIAGFKSVKQTTGEDKEPNE